MFNMSDLSIELELTEKSYTFLFNNFPDSVLLNPLDALSKQSQVVNVALLLSALNLKISFPLPNK